MEFSNCTWAMILTVYFGFSLIFSIVSVLFVSVFGLRLFEFNRYRFGMGTASFIALLGLVAFLYLLNGQCEQFDWWVFALWYVASAFLVRLTIVVTQSFLLRVRIFWR